MINKEERILLQDLSARLPYGVFVSNTEGGRNIKGFLCEVNSMYACVLIDTDLHAHNSEDCEFSPVGHVRPYLRKLTSITEEEKNELEDFINVRYVEKYCEGKESLFVDNLNVRKINQIYDWCNMNHFDYRGLIENELAIEVTADNNPYK